MSSNTTEWCSRQADRQAGRQAVGRCRSAQNNVVGHHSSQVLVLRDLLVVLKAAILCLAAGDRFSAQALHLHGGRAWKGGGDKSRARCCAGQTRRRYETVVFRAVNFGTSVPGTASPAGKAAWKTCTCRMSAHAFFS